jgi:hypothetical protein
MADPDGERVPATRPALWRPTPQPRARFLASTAVALVMAAGAVAMAVLVEHVVFASPSTPTVVSVEAVETLVQHEGASQIYRVRLPDGSTTRLHTTHILQGGDRVTAMVSRGRLTGRLFATPPHSAPVRSGGRP